MEKESFEDASHLETMLLSLRNEHLEMVGKIDETLKKLKSKQHYNTNYKEHESENDGVVCVDENKLLNKINRLVCKIDSPNSLQKDAIKENYYDNSPGVYSKKNINNESEISTMAYLQKYNLAQPNVNNANYKLNAEKHENNRIFNAPGGKLFE